MKTCKRVTNLDHGFVGPCSTDRALVMGGKSFTYFTQDEFVRHMKDLKDPQWEHKKKPYGALVSDDRKTVFIIKCKDQVFPGFGKCVDEKIRGGPCLRDEYKKLYPTVDKFELLFIVNDRWFMNKEYEIGLELNEIWGSILFAKHGLIKRLMKNRHLRAER